MARKPAKRVREPIQVYLTADDRALLDDLAKRTGLSRAEVLRRGLRSFGAERAGSGSPFLDYLLSLRGDDWPADIAERHDDYLAEAYLDLHEGQ